MYVTGTNTLAKQVKDQREQANNLRVKIKLNKLQDEIYKPFWIQQQQDSYKNVVQLAPSETIENVLNPNIIDKYLANKSDLEQNKAQALQNLLTLTGNDKIIAEQIISKLDHDDISAFNQQFGYIKQNIKTLFPKGLRKETLIAFIKQKITPKWLTNHSFNSDPAFNSELDYTLYSDVEPTSQTSYKKQAYYDKKAEQLSSIIPESRIGVNPELFVNDKYGNKNLSFESTGSVPQTVDSFLKKIQSQKTSKIKLKDYIKETVLLNPNEKQHLLENFDKTTKNKSIEIIKEYLYVKEPSDDSGEEILVPKKKAIYGKGLPASQKTSSQSNSLIIYYHPKSNTVSLSTNPYIFLELDKLVKNNILRIKYKSTRNTHHEFRQMRISQELSDIIQDILHEKFNVKLLKILKPREKVVLNKFLQITKIKNINVDEDELKEFNKNFDILVGEIESGNDNPELKTKLREYINLAIKLKRLPRNEAYDLLMNLK